MEDVNSQGLTVGGSDNENLTILLLTYNRLEYLKQAVKSCIDQINQNFSLLIVDNHSADGTRAYLSELALVRPKTKIIINEKNLGPRESFLIGMRAATPGWITILCDDDRLTNAFVNRFWISRQRYPDASCIVVSVQEINELGNLGFSFINPEGFSAPKEAFRLIGNGAIRPAGVSGFCFSRDWTNDRHFWPIPDYPNGYLSDTLLLILSSIESGLATTSEICYQKRIWKGQESDYSNDRSAQYFTALVMFDSDLRIIFRDTKYSELRSLLKTMPLLDFGKIVLFPIFALGFLTRKQCLVYLKAAWHHNKRYLPHALLVVLMWPFVLQPTLGLRVWLNKTRKRLKLRREG